MHKLSINGVKPRLTTVHNIAGQTLEIELNSGEFMAMLQKKCVIYRKYIHKCESEMRGRGTDQVTVDMV